MLETTSRSEKNLQELLEGYHESRDRLRSGTAAAPTRNWSENFKKGIKTRYSNKCTQMIVIISPIRPNIKNGSRKNNCHPLSCRQLVAEVVLPLFLDLGRTESGGSRLSLLAAKQGRASRD